MVDNVPQQSIFSGAPMPGQMTKEQKARKFARDAKWRAVAHLRAAMTDEELEAEARRIRAQVASWEHERRRAALFARSRHAA